MKRLILVFIAILTSLVMSLNGCNCGSSLDETGLKITAAPIHTVVISTAYVNTAGVIVYIKGGLADSCTTFHETIVERDGNVITITIMVERPKNTLCAEIYEYFDEEVNLGSDFVSGETYIVKVNDETEYFVMP